MFFVLFFPLHDSKYNLIKPVNILHALAMNKYISALSKLNHINKVRKSKVDLQSMIEGAKVYSLRVCLLQS